MGKKAMKAPGVTGGNMRGGTKRSPLGPTSISGAASMGVDDASAEDVYSAGLRPRKLAGSSGSDAALGVKGTRGRTATNASAQFRITAKRTPFSQESYPGTLAAGKVLPSVMGSKQNFAGGRAASTY